ncbi:MAG: alpha/beta hydrolase [Bacteroidetes bacterium]|nr:alpha/beta hydrolase [Bacteroidota bacterium]
MRIYKTWFLVFVITLQTLSCKKVEQLQEKVLDPDKKQTLYDVPYGDHIRNNMDIALPKNRTTNTPVVIFIHGGAWVMGQKGVFLKEIDMFADAGFACATINYRFASEINHLHHTELMQDIRKAVDYIASKSEKWQVSPNNFGLVGQSAGGHLSMMAAYTYNPDHIIKACASWAGPVNFTDAEQLAINGAHQIFEVYVGCSLHSHQDTVSYKASSPYWNTQNAVPTLLIHGTNDIGVPYSNLPVFKEQLDASGIKNSFVTFDSEGHLWYGSKLNEARNLTLDWFKQELYNTN